MNKLYEMSLCEYTNFVQDILKQEWFKEDCKNKKIKLTYLARDFFKAQSQDIYALYKEGRCFYAEKYSLVYFHEIEHNNPLHVKLLNINLRNKTYYYIFSFAMQFQERFLVSKRYIDLEYISTQEFLSHYSKLYDSYLDASLFSKTVRKLYLKIEDKRYSMRILLPKKNLLYSFYISDIIQKSREVMDDKKIADVLFQCRNITLSRRMVCYIRKKHLIPSVYLKNREFACGYSKIFFDSKKELNKHNVRLLKQNMEGIYELSSDTTYTYGVFQTNIIYIGSSKDIRSRLFQYLYNGGHSLLIRQYLKNNKVYFRVLKAKKAIEEEKKALDSFKILSQQLPHLNQKAIR